MPSLSKIHKNVAIKGSRSLTIGTPQPDSPSIADDPRQDTPRLTDGEAEKILAAAYEEAQKIRKEAHREGFDAGYREGMTLAEREQEKMLDGVRELQRRAARCLAEARQRQQISIKEAEQEVVRLSLEIAEKLLHQQLQVAPDTVARLVRYAVSELLGDGEMRTIKIYLHPEDEHFCRERMDLLREAVSEQSELELLCDAQLSRGSCRVETEDGAIEILLDRELGYLRQILLEMTAEAAVLPEEDSREDEH